MHTPTSTFYHFISFFFRLSPPPSSMRRYHDAHDRTQAYREGSYTYRNAYVFREWRQDPRRHVTGAPLLCRREFAPDEAALRQQTATGVSRQAPVVLSTQRYILRGRRARGQSTLDDRRSRSSIVYFNSLSSKSSFQTSLSSSNSTAKQKHHRITDDMWRSRPIRRCAPFKSPALRENAVNM